MAINYNPFSQFNVEPSSFSLPAGMTMNQAATTNAMMQPVSLLGQQSFGAPQQAFQFEEEEEDSFGESLLAGLTFLGTALTRGPGKIVPSSGGSLAPTGQIVPSFSRPMINVTGSVPQLSLPGSTAAPAVLGGASKLARFGSPGSLLYGGADLLTELITGRGLSERIGEGVGGAVGNFLFPGAQELPAFTNAGTLAELAEMSAPVDRDRDPIRATYQLGPDYNNETIMERESGEIFAPSASQLEAFMDGMEAASQPTATGLGLGGSEGVVFGGGQAPMTQAETRARIAELFELDAPATLNQAMLNDPDAVMATDAQGRMRSFESPEARQQNLFNAQSAFDLASLDRLARLEERDVRPGETLQERDTRIADSRTEGTDRGGEMTFEEARKFVPKRTKEKAKAYNERIKAFQTEQNSRLNKLKENLQELKVTGQELNNDRVRGLIVKYARSEPQRYGQVLAEAQAMFADGRIKDETEMALYIIEEMGDDVSSVTDKSDGSKSSMIDKVIQSGQGGSPSSGIQPGQVVEQGGKRYRFDGVNYNEI
jgi:hypothetical protein